MRGVPAAALAFSALLRACSGTAFTPSPEPHPPPADRVVLTGTDYEKLGARTAPAARATYQAEVRGYGVVLSAAPLAQADANIESAQASVGQSEAVLAHAQALFRTSSVSLEALQAAEKTATANEVQLALAERQEVALYGEAAPWQGPPRDETIVGKISSGGAVVVQATFPLDVHITAVSPRFTLTHLNEELTASSATTSTIWRAPADPTIPGQSFFALVEGSSLSQGERVLVHAPAGEPESGVLIPADAVVIAGPKAWCYVLEAPLTFRRVEVDINRPLNGGYFIPSGVRPGQAVLVKGTGLMLARELGGSAAGASY